MESVESQGQLPVMDPTDANADVETNASIVTNVKPLINYITQYVRTSLMRTHIDKIQQDGHAVEIELKQIKTYVLGLEERIAILEKDVGQHKLDFETIGTQMADISAVTKQLMPVEKKKRHFFNR